DGAEVAAERVQERARLRIPEARCRIAAPRRHQGAVRGEPDRRHRPRVPAQDHLGPVRLADADEIPAHGRSGAVGRPGRSGRSSPASTAPVSAFQTRPVPSALAVTILVPSGLKETSVTGFECPDITATGDLSEIRNTRAVPSLLAEASSVARGLKARSRTGP